MKTQDDLKPNTQFALAIVGKPFSRKTSAAIHFPKPMIFDCDRKLAMVRSYYPNLKFNYVEPDLNEETGKEVPDAQKWTNFVGMISRYALHPDTRVNIIDSMSRVSEYLCYHIIGQGAPGKPLIVGGEAVMTQQMWYPYKELMTSLIMRIRSAGKPCIFTFHEWTEKDETTGTFNLFPKISGQLRDDVAKLFTDVWRTETRQVPTAQGLQTKYFIRTEPTNLMAQLGHSSPLPAEFEFDWNIIAKAYPHLVCP